MTNVETTLYEVTIIDSLDRQINTVIESELSVGAILEDTTRECSSGGFVAFTGARGYPSVFVRTPQNIYIEEIEEEEEEE